MSLIVKIGADTRKFDKEMRRLTKDVSTIGKKLGGIGKSMTKGITAPLAGVGVAVAKTGMQFESSMSQVAATMGKPKSEISELEKLARDMGKSTKFSATEAADAINYMALAGWDSQSIMQGLPGLLDLAAAGGMDLATAADIVTDGMTGMGLSASETNRIVDLMAKTASSSNTSVEQMGKAMILVAGQSNTLGIAQNDLALSLGLMANAGFKGEIAGQHLSAGIRRIVSPSKKAQKAMDQYGIVLKRNKDGSVDLGGTIEDMRGKLNGLDKVQKATALSAIFGADAQKSWGGIINASQSDFDKLKSSIEASDGAAHQMAETMIDNLAGRMEIMKSALSEVAIQLYEHMHPALEKIVEWITKAAEAFSNISPKTQGFIVAIAALLGAVGPLLVALASIIKVAGFIKAAFTAIGVASMGAFAIWILIGVALAALVIAIITYWDEIKDVTIKVWNVIKDFMTELWKSIVDIAKSVWEPIADFFSGLWNSIKDITTSVWQSISDFFSEWGLTILAIITGPIGILVGLIVKYWDEIKAFTSTIWNGIKGFLTSIWQGIVAVFGPIFSAIASVITGIWNTIKTVTSAVWNFISQYLKAIWDALMIFVKPVFDKMAAYFTAIWNSIKTIATTVWNAIKSFLMTVWNGIYTTASSIFNKLKAFFTTIFNAIKAVFTTIWNAIKSFITSVWNSIKSTAVSIWNSIKSAVMGPVNQMKSMITSAFNTLKGSVSKIFNSIKSVAVSVWNSIYGSVSGKVSSLVSSVKGAFNGLKSSVIGVWNGIKSGIKTAINGIISIINKFIGAFNGPAKLLNKLPGVSAPIIPNIPMLATGGTMFGSGNAIVGEAGPELVSKSGSSVKVTPLSSQEKAGGIGGALGSGGGGGTVEVPVIIDGREIARATAPYMDNELRGRRDSKNRAKGGW